LKTDLEKRGYLISEGELTFNIEIVPGAILTKIQKKFDATNTATRSFSDYEIKVLSPAYDLILIAREIINQESQYCNFDYNGFMLLYPQYEIKRISYDESRVYILKDRKSGKIFKFAVRSCAFPPGI
jgi:hypothetical protein